MDKSKLKQILTLLEKKGCKYKMKKEKCCSHCDYDKKKRKMYREEEDEDFEDDIDLDEEEMVEVPKFLIDALFDFVMEGDYDMDDEEYEDDEDEVIISRDRDIPEESLFTTRMNQNSLYKNVNKKDDCKKCKGKKKKGCDCIKNLHKKSSIFY